MAKRLYASELARQAVCFRLFNQIHCHYHPKIIFSWLVYHFSKIFWLFIWYALFRLPVLSALSPFSILSVVVSAYPHRFYSLPFWTPWLCLTALIDYFSFVVISESMRTFLKDFLKKRIFWDTQNGGKPIQKASFNWHHGCIYPYAIIDCPLRRNTPHTFA